MCGMSGGEVGVAKQAERGCCGAFPSRTEFALSNESLHAEGS